MNLPLLPFCKRTTLYFYHHRAVLSSWRSEEGVDISQWLTKITLSHYCTPLHRQLFTSAVTRSTSHECESHLSCGCLSKSNPSGPQRAWFERSVYSDFAWPFWMRESSQTMRIVPLEDSVQGHPLHATRGNRDRRSCTTRRSSGRIRRYRWSVSRTSITFGRSGRCCRWRISRLWTNLVLGTEVLEDSFAFLEARVRVAFLHCSEIRNFHDLHFSDSSLRLIFPKRTPWLPSCHLTASAYYNAIALLWKQRACIYGLYWAAIFRNEQQGQFDTFTGTRQTCYIKKSIVVNSQDGNMQKTAQK